MTENKKIKFIYFGTGFFSEAVLKNLLEKGVKPSYIITSPDRPQGRHQIIIDGPIKKLAKENNIPFLQPEKLKSEEFLNEFKNILDEDTICVVCDYGKILPQVLLDLKTVDFINIHPSLLPDLRGPAPLQYTILQNKNNTGVTILQIDAEMDHGPITMQDQKKFDEVSWPISILELSDELAKLAAIMLITALDRYENKQIIYIQQNHPKATYTKMIDKKDAEIFPDKESIEDIYRKYQAYKHWPEIFYINKDGKRVKIKKMDKGGVKRVIVEGKNESDFVGW